MIRWLSVFVFVAALVAARLQWSTIRQLRSENDQLRAELESLHDRNTVAANADGAAREQELQRLKNEVQEVVRLRGEVTRLRSGAKEFDKLRSETQQLRAENDSLRSKAGVVPAPTGAPPAKDQFPKESWTFSGYASPEAALVSAVWAMKEGNPKTYLDSLSPEEQARMVQEWGNKPENELASKHQQDVANITAVRILDRQSASPGEVTMNVYIEGVGRMEKVLMKQIGNDWKFGGFVHPPPK